MLAAHFLTKHHHGEGAPPQLGEDTLAALASYAWPGNIRELENEIERLNVLASGEAVIHAALLSERITDAIASAQPSTDRAKPVATTASGKAKTLRELVEAMEADVIHQGLIRTHWNKSQLAKELGISRTNLIQKCSTYGLEQKNS